MDDGALIHHTRTSNLNKILEGYWKSIGGGEDPVRKF